MVLDSYPPYLVKLLLEFVEYHKMMPKNDGILILQSHRTNVTEKKNSKHNFGYVLKKYMNICFDWNREVLPVRRLYYYL